MNTVDWLKKLVSIDSTSHYSNLEIIHTIEKWLNKFGISNTRIPNDAGEKANLLAILPDKLGVIQHGIILSGHTDVVPVKDQDWDSPPFKATMIDNKIYGRGTADMKGFIAVILSLIPRLAKAKLEFPIYLAFSYDEEIGCIGAPFLIQKIREHHLNPYACIVGEPTEMQPIIAHKGIQAYECTFYGKAAHSSLTPHACNAIEYAAQLIQWIAHIGKELKLSATQDNLFDVPYTTITTNIIQGGSAANIIPSLCQFTFEFRNLPEHHPEDIIKQIQDYAYQQILPAMKKEFSEARIDITKTSSVPYFNSSLQHDSKNILQPFLHGLKKKVSYATEAGLFELANIPSILCGPGSIEQAHKPNEFITLEQLSECETLLNKILLRD